MTYMIKRTILVTTALSLAGSAGAFASALDHNPLEAILSAGQQFNAESQLKRIIKNNPFALDRDSSVEMMGAVEAEGFTTVKARQLHKGIPVLGTIVTLEDGNTNNVFSELRSLSLSIEPRVSEEQALGIAQGFSKNAIARKPQLAIMPSSDRSLNRLTYWVDVPSTKVNPGVEVVIDAMNGQVLAEIPKVHTAADAALAPITVMDAKEDHMIIDPVFSERSPAEVMLGLRPKLLGCTISDPVTGKSKYFDSEEKCNAFFQDTDPDLHTRCQAVLKDSIRDGRSFAVGYDPKKCAFPFVDSQQLEAPSVPAQKAYDNTKLVLEYLRDELNRNSYDGNGGEMVSVVNGGVKLSNAAWFSDQNIMVYGAGDGVEFGNFTQLVDVAGHEMTHGMVSKTANLSYMDESGALNEAVADFFGKMIAKDGHWLIGKGLYKSDPNRGLRSLEKPSMYDARFIDQLGVKSRKPYPETLAQKFQSFGECNADNDRCYVHTNSTIISHAFYSIHQALGREKAQKILYNALIRYMTSLTNFRGAAAALRKACSDLYDPASCALVDNSLKAGGM